MSDLKELISDFVEQLSAAVEAEVVTRVRTNIDSLLSNGARRSVTPLALAPVRPRKKAPIQLCPVPGCKNRAAPIFGMVCAAHKDLPKKKVREYREARRAAKSKPMAKRAAVRPARKRAPARKPVVAAATIGAPAASPTAAAA